MYSYSEQCLSIGIVQCATLSIKEVRIKCGNKIPTIGMCTAKWNLVNSTTFCDLNEGCTVRLQSKVYVGDNVVLKGQQRLIYCFDGFLT